ncbi:MAG: hypothetical protein AB7L13_17995 [Acidimicrobiia bacterium]
MSPEPIDTVQAPPTTTAGLELDLLSELSDGPPLPGRERVTSGATYVLLGVLALGLSFLGGAWFERNHGPTTSTAVAATPIANAAAASGGAAAATAVAGGAGRATGANAANGANPNGANAAGAAGAGGFGGGTTGEVKLVDGTTVYLLDASGNTIKVSATASTPVTVTKSGTVADLVAGEQVVVVGQTNADGTVTATQIRSGTAGIGAGRGGQGTGAPAGS